MKISLNWLKKYVNIPVADDELIRLIGARLVEVEGVIDEMHKYDKIYVVKVITAEKIPETHLTLCQIDNGSNELVQVVCGAPNVREGMLAAWIAPGAIVPASVHEDAPFVIGRRKMLGKYESNGMLAGADELDFGEDHSGIVEIDPAIAGPGVTLADVFDLKDLILEIENKSLTHRPDCFGLIGFAREVAGILGVKFTEPNFSSAEFEFLGTSRIGGELSLSVRIADASICARYTAIVMEKHGELKKKYLTYIDTLLAKAGMRPIDSIVDATNYLMLLTGQPLHAFDYDKFVAVGGKKQPEINVRLARNGEKLTLLDGKETDLNDNDIVICSGDEPVALAGAMGGLVTAIDDNTKNIILESATFSLYNLRKTQMAHGIFSEAITRFTKGQPAYQTLKVAKKCAEMLSDGFRVSEVVDVYTEDAHQVKVEITTDEINNLLGTTYDKKTIMDTLENVGFKIHDHREDLKITVPEWRTDIHIKEDIIEEVGRLLGYDNIVPVLSRHLAATPNKMLELKTKVRDILSGFGGNELLTYSFVSERLLKKAGLDAKNSYKIINSISPDLQYIRQSIVPSLLEKSYMNQKIPFDKFALFEMNKIYRKEWGMNDENVPIEKMSLGFVLTERKGTGTAYYRVKRFAEELLREFNIAPKFLPIREKNAENLPFESKRAAEVWVNDEYLGVLGEFKNSVRRNYKLADYLAGFEFDMDMILKFAGMKKINCDFEIKDKQDLTVSSAAKYIDIFHAVQDKYPEAIITPVSIYQPDNSDVKNTTFHLEFH